MTQRVLTIHGINSLGEWQGEIQKVLEPHFECIHLTYEEYQLHGERKILLDQGRKSRTLEDLREQYERATSGRVRPHLIAHSFGTVLSAALLRAWPFVRMSRMIFAGSALPARFDWDSMLTQDPEKFYDLRNETGGKDWVARLAGVAGHLGFDLGDAGWAGFSGSGIHTLAGPLLRCRLCPADGEQGRKARVHNAPLTEFDHHSMFASRRHVTDVWLPFLWGFSPRDYLEFLELCQQVRELYAEGALVEARMEERRLKAWQWRWVGGKEKIATLEEYILLHLAQSLEDRGISWTPGRLAELGALVVQGMCEAVMSALEERDKAEGRELKRLKALHPRNAVIRAVEELMPNLGGARSRP